MWVAPPRASTVALPSHSSTKRRSRVTGTGANGPGFFGLPFIAIPPSSLPPSDAEPRDGDALHPAREPDPWYHRSMGSTILSARAALASLATTALLAAGSFACEEPAFEPVRPGEAPFVGPWEGVPSSPARLPEPPSLPPVVEEQAPPPGLPPEPGVDDEFSRRRAAWLGEPFRCKAISTTKLRGCRFEAHEGGHRLRFPVADAVCEDVEFDAAGDPARLVGCKGGWLVMPREAELARARGQDVWSGSHRGWRWRDGERYCCPGLWLEAPKSLRR